MYFEELNEKQKKAITEEHNRICVIAGPGCGKTRTLVGRFIYLIEKKNCYPENILILTFAKKAIEEIKKRISSIIINDKFHIYNFHSFCFRILKEHSYLLGFKENMFPLYDRNDQESVIKKLIYKYNYNSNRREINEIINFISYLKNGKINKENLDFSDEIIKLRYKIYEEYQKYLRINKAIDFNDLLIYTIFLFENYPKIRQTYKEKFKNILLDEFQDINSIQWKIVELISSENQNIFLVGDPNQAIYGFQGANSQLISSFYEDKKNWKSIFLNVNYRSSEKIIYLTNSFIKRNEGDLVQNILLTSKENNFSEIIWMRNFSVYLLIEKIKSIILNNKNIKFNNIAIIYRNNSLSIEILRKLNLENIPYQILGSYDFIKREEIKDLLSILRTIIYGDNISFLRFLKFQEKIGIRTIEFIEEESKKNNCSIYDYLNEKNNLLELINKKNISSQLKKIFSLIKKINKWKENLRKNYNLNNFIKETIYDFEYLETLKKFTNYEERKKNVQQFIIISKDWETEKIEKEYKVGEFLNEFLQWINIAFESKKKVKNVNNLILSSIHQTKGLEFEVVFFIYLDHGIIPYRDTENLLEEKRLFYVAITRAKSILVLASTNFPSYFFNYLDKKFLRII